MATAAPPKRLSKTTRRSSPGRNSSMETIRQAEQLKNYPNTTITIKPKNPGPFSMAVGIQPNQRNLREISFFPQIARKDAEKTYQGTSAGSAGDFFFPRIAPIEAP